MTGPDHRDLRDDVGAADIPATEWGPSEMRRPEGDEQPAFWPHGRTFASGGIPPVLVDQLSRSAASWKAHAEQMERERDAALAEIDRLTVLAEQHQSVAAVAMQAAEDARAEVERLSAEVARYRFRVHFGSQKWGKCEDNLSNAEAEVERLTRERDGALARVRRRDRIIHQDERGITSRDEQIAGLVDAATVFDAAYELVLRFGADDLPKPMLGDITRARATVERVLRTMVAMTTTPAEGDR